MPPLKTERSRGDPQALAALLRAIGDHLVDAPSGYEPYVATRAFWEHRGFVQIDCIDPLPGWDPGSPSAIYARSIP